MGSQTRLGLLFSAIPALAANNRNLTFIIAIPLTVKVKWSKSSCNFQRQALDRKRRANLIESATPCHNTQAVGLYRVSNPVCLTVLVAKSADNNITVLQHLLNQITAISSIFVIYAQGLKRKQPARLKKQEMLTKTALLRRTQSVQRKQILMKPEKTALMRRT